MHRHCLRSSISHCSDPIKGSLGRTRQFLSNLPPSFSGAVPSLKSLHPKSRSLQKSAIQQSQIPKSNTLDFNYSNTLSTNESLAPTGNLAQEKMLGDEDEGGMQPFTPGTFVEIRRNERAVQAVVLAETIENQKFISHALSSQGQIFTHQRQDVHFSIPNLVSASLAERCGYREPTPENSAARVEVLKKLQNLVSKIDQQMAGMEQKPLRVYIEVMDPDPTKWTTTTVAHVTSLLYQRPSFLDYYMVHRYLIDQPLQYLANPSYLQTQQFYVRPRRDIEEIEKVIEYIHMWRDGLESPFSEFVSKARSVVERYKERRQSGPITQEKIDVTWNDEERIILNFLLRSLQSHRSNQSDPYETGRTELVKAILRPTTQVNDHMTFELALQLGIIAPWQDLHELDTILNPWGDFTFKQTIENQGKQLLKESLASKPKAGSVVGPMDFLPSDPLESIRHDFGDMPVFVIDDPTAEELDDGLSLERISNEPENYWVHVHVADPTSVIHPNHVLAKMARQQGSTYYLSQKSIPLFPTALVHHPTFSLSLGGKGENVGMPNRVITFSIKLDGNGNILDYKARAGIIRNVKKKSYSEVNIAADMSQPTIRYPLGGAAEPVSVSTFDESDIQDLKVLGKLADDQVSKRMREGIWQYGNVSTRMRWNSQIPPDIRTPSLESSIYHGFPDLTYEVDEDSAYKGSHSMVAEMMKLANRVASRIFLDHNVPAIRHGFDYPLTKSPQAMEEILKARTPWGAVSEKDITQHLEIFNSGQFCLEPKGHFSLGIPKGEGYVRATSPLRRFEDMVNHWQLQNILLKSNSPRFSASDLEKMITELEPLSRINRKISNSRETSLSLMYLDQYAAETARGAERPFGDPLSSMDAWISKNIADTITNQPTLQVVIPLLGMKATIIDGPMSLANAPRCMDLRVKFDSVELGIKRARLLVTAVE